MKCGKLYGREKDGRAKSSPKSADIPGASTNFDEASESISASSRASKSAGALSERVSFSIFENTFTAAAILFAPLDAHVFVLRHSAHDKYYDFVRGPVDVLRERLQLAA